MSDDIMRRLAAAFERTDPVPAAVRDAAGRAGRLVGPAPLLALVTDGVRGAPDVLGFARPGVRVDVQVEAGEAVSLTGVTTSGEVFVRWPGGRRRADVDGLGRFTVTGLPRGPLSVVLGDPDAAGPWFVA